MRSLTKKLLGRVLQWNRTHLSGSSAKLLFQSSRALGVPLASCRMYMAKRPVTSTSQALGTSDWLIMLIKVHGTIPKNSSNAVQHWTAVPDRPLVLTQPSTTVPNLAIFSSPAAGLESVLGYFLIGAGFALTFLSLSASRSTLPRTSYRSTGSTAMPAGSRLFSRERT